MPRKLRTYTTSAGFFDLAVAAPSMKAALEAWGSASNLFHHGFATVTDDPQVVAATMARPGVVMRRPVGSAAAFSEHAELPVNFDAGPRRQKSARAAGAKRRKPTKPIEEGTARQAAQAFEREQERRRRRERKEEAAREKERVRRDRAVAAAEANLERARRAHHAKLGEIEKARAALEKDLEAEERRWKKRQGQLEDALRRFRSTHLRLV
jgi:hypothetical protein